MDTIEAYSTPKALVSHVLDHLTIKRLNLHVDESSKTILLPIPKNANSFLKTIFLHNSPATSDFDFRKETPLQYKRRASNVCPVVGKRKILRDPSYKKILILRRPERRLLSCYLDKVVKKLPMQHPAINKTLKKETHEMTFRDFVRYVACNADFKRDRHYRTQSSFVSLYPIDFDFVGSVERLDETLTYLQHERGMAIPDPEHPGTTKSTNYSRFTEPSRDVSDLPACELRNFQAFPPPDAFLPSFLLRCIQNTYKEDMELYNYHCG